MNNDIQIDGLNKQQRALADVIWAMDDKDTVVAFIDSLRGQARRDADVVIAMILWAVLDQYENTEDASRELKQFMLQ
jgi:hypothetical protein